MAASASAQAIANIKNLKKTTRKKGKVKSQSPSRRIDEEVPPLPQESYRLDSPHQVEITHQIEAARKGLRLLKSKMRLNKLPNIQEPLPARSQPCSPELSPRQQKHNLPIINVSTQHLPTAKIYSQKHRKLGTNPRQIPKKMNNSKSVGTLQNQTHLPNLKHELDKGKLESSSTMLHAQFAQQVQEPIKISDEGSEPMQPLIIPHVQKKKHSRTQQMLYDHFQDQIQYPSYNNEIAHRRQKGKSQQDIFNGRFFITTRNQKIYKRSSFCRLHSRKTSSQSLEKKKLSPEQFSRKEPRLSESKFEEGSSYEKHLKDCKKFYIDKKKEVSEEFKEISTEERNTLTEAKVRLAQVMGQNQFIQKAKFRALMRQKKSESQQSGLKLGMEIFKPPDQRVECPYCDRKFSQFAANRHILQCSVKFKSEMNAAKNSVGSILYHK